MHEPMGLNSVDSFTPNFTPSVQHVAAVGQNPQNRSWVT